MRADQQGRSIAWHGIKPRVVVVQPWLVQYRVSLFEQLRTQLAAAGVTLHLVHGAAPPILASQRDASTLWWADARSTHWIPGTARRAGWTPLGRLGAETDLIIVQETVGSLSTYEAMLRRGMGGARVACWGHGPGPEDHAPHAVTRRVRSSLARRYDWWFTYTAGTRERLRAAGVPVSRITTLYNTIDVAELRNCLAAARASAEVARQELGLRGPTALYLGALRTDKRIDVLLAVGARIAAAVPGFTLLIGGDGPERGRIEQALSGATWLRYLGAVFGPAKAHALAVADIMLQPAHLGLVVLDAFAAGLPIVTFDEAGHGPEEEYLVDGVHGVRVRGDRPEDLADAAVALLRDPVRRRPLGSAAWSSGSSHTIESMAERFSAGIVAALEAPPRRRSRHLLG